MVNKIVDAEMLDNGLTAIADSIRAKTGEQGALAFPDGFVGAVNGIEQGGGETGVDLFSYIQTPPMFDLSISEVTEDITLHMEKATGVNAMFDVRIISAPKVTLYISDKCTNMFRVLRRGSGTNTDGLRTVEIIGDTSKITQYGAAFLYRSTIETINCEFDFSSATNVQDMFIGCAGLREVRIAPRTLSLSMSWKDSALLSAGSVQSIVEGLADLTDTATQTLTLHADTAVIDEQKATITLKNWTLVQ